MNKEAPLPGGGALSPPCQTLRDRLLSKRRLGIRNATEAVVSEGFASLRKPLPGPEDGKEARALRDKARLCQVSPNSPGTRTCQGKGDAVTLVYRLGGPCLQNSLNQDSLVPP